VLRETKVHLVNKDLADMMVSMAKTAFLDRLVLLDDKVVMAPKVKLVNQGPKDRLAFVDHQDLPDALAQRVNLDVWTWISQK